MTALVARILGKDDLEDNEKIKGWLAFHCQSDDDGESATAYHLVPLYRQLLYKEPVLGRKVLVDEVDGAVGGGNAVGDENTVGMTAAEAIEKMMTGKHKKGQMKEVSQTAVAGTAAREISWGMRVRVKVGGWFSRGGGYTPIHDISKTKTAMTRTEGSNHIIRKVKSVDDLKQYDKADKSSIREKFRRYWFAHPDKHSAKESHTPAGDAPTAATSEAASPTIVKKSTPPIRPSTMPRTRSVGTMALGGASSFSSSGTARRPVGPWPARRESLAYSRIQDWASDISGRDEI